MMSSLQAFFRRQRTCATGFAAIRSPTYPALAQLLWLRGSGG